ncbi:MAG: hypothetical protein IRZ28_22515 [Steroidobacteraceae bacterium]|nr:hypothetical protein [Steroidobacteraceae bacterium]
MALADYLAARGDKELAKTLKTSPKQVREKFRPLLEALAQPGTHTPEKLATDLGCTAKQVRVWLTRLVSAHPGLFDSTAEFMPGTKTIVSMIETRLGQQIVAQNLSEANRACIEIVDNIVRPRYASFIRRELKDYIDAATDRLSMQVEELVPFLLEEYRVFVKQQDQGLVSKAGGLNEAILVRALTNEGLVEGDHFEVTGTKSRGDLAVYCNAPRTTLLVEVKSFGARERLLRGLQDIQPPKVGVGFFTQANEFNAERTQQFLDTQALAIYMPEATYAALDDVARARQNLRATPFYRPLNQYPGDMRAFTERGVGAYSPR